MEIAILERIRILLGEMSPGMRSVLRQTVMTQPDMEVVAEVEDGMELLLATGRNQPDMVILGVEGLELPGICSHLLNEYPHIKVLAMTADGRRASLYEFQLREVLLGLSSQQDLVDAIRQVVRD